MRHFVEKLLDIFLLFLFSVPCSFPHFFPSSFFFIVFSLPVSQLWLLIYHLTSAPQFLILNHFSPISKQFSKKCKPLPSISLKNLQIMSSADCANSSLYHVLYSIPIHLLVHLKCLDIQCCLTSSTFMST